MASEPLCCPYCNAYVSLPAGTLREGQRLLCSRCGESFALRGFPRETVSESLPHPLSAYAPQPAGNSPAAQPLIRHSWSNRFIAAIILGGMAIMAAIGILISLATQGVRRAHDAGLPKDRTLPLYLAVFVGIWVIGLAFVAVRELRLRYQRSTAGQPLPLGYILATITFLAVGGLAVTMLAVQISKQRASRAPLTDMPSSTVQRIAPASLPTLGYLPADTDLVAGVHVAEILGDPPAKEFLTRLRFGPGDTDLNVLERWTGLRLQDMDNIVLGLRIQGELIPRVNLVVRTTRPYDPAAIRKALHATRTPEPGKKELYRVKLEKSVLTPVLWFADERTLLVGLKPEDFARVPTKPREGIDHLQTEIRSFLKERLGQGTPAWLAGYAENWDIQWRILLDRQAREGQPVELLAQVRTFGVWFQFSDGVTLNAAFQCTDEGAASALESYLIGRTLADKKPFHMAAPRPELGPIFRELGQSVKSNRNQAWLVVQAKAGAETLWKAFTP
jgi:hypothetical protein